MLKAQKKFMFESLLLIQLLSLGTMISLTGDIHANTSFPLGTRTFPDNVWRNLNKQMIMIFYC